MALRGFVGDDGQEWQVWDTRPAIPSPNVDASDATHAGPPSDKVADFSRFSKKREGGWLTFTTPHERRRLSPIPDHWESADEASLRALLAVADRIVAGEE